MIEVVYMDTPAFVLKEAQKINILPESSKIVELVFCLTHGDISKINTLEDRYLFGGKVKFKRSVKKILKIAQKDRKIRIWTSRSDIYEYLGFLFTLDLLQDREAEISVIFSDDTVVEYLHNDNTSERYSPPSIACCSVEQITEIMKTEKTLTKNEIQTFLTEWQTIKNENSPLRILENKKIKSVADDYYDDTLLKILSEQDGSITIIRLCGEFLADNVFIWDRFLFERIDELIKSGKIILIEKNKRQLYKSIIKLTPNKETTNAGN
jgi:hypothetical protein